MFVSGNPTLPSKTPSTLKHLLDLEKNILKMEKNQLKNVFFQQFFKKKKQQKILPNDPYRNRHIFF